MQRSTRFAGLDAEKAREKSVFPQVSFGKKRDSPASNPGTTRAHKARMVDNCGVRMRTG
jgi:hypothetical protein